MQIINDIIDFFRNIYPLTLTLLILEIILGILYIFFEKRIIGKFGEFWVRRELKKLDEKIYKTINDTTFIVDDITHQIDHIVVSKYGIFVIETKQLNGYIKGNEYDNKWIQNNRIYINNPIHQNYGHIKTLQRILNISENKFIPIVCISSTAKVNVKSKSHVVRIYELNKTIISYTSEILPDYNAIYNRIIESKITDKDIIKKHNERVKQIIKEKSINIDENKCPFCGGNLVERKGKYGAFIGCSNYPKCKFTKRIKQ